MRRRRALSPSSRTSGSAGQPGKAVVPGNATPFHLNLPWDASIWNRSATMAADPAFPLPLALIGLSPEPLVYRGRSVSLYEHEGATGAMVRVPALQSLRRLPDEIRGKVSAVLVEGPNVWVLLYEQEDHGGLALVVNSGRLTERVVNMAALDFEDRPGSIRTVQMPTDWRQVLMLGELARDEGRYDLRGTTYAEDFADWVRRTIARGNARECRWERLELNVPQSRMEGLLYIRHRHYPGSVFGDQYLYSYTQRLMFQVDLKQPDGAGPKVRLQVLGKGVTIDTGNVVRQLLEAGVIPCSTDGL